MLVLLETIFLKKKLYFEYYPALKEGNFLGELISTNSSQATKTYELKLPTDIMFSKVHGDIKLVYLVYENEKIVMLDKFEEDTYSNYNIEELNEIKVYESLYKTAKECLNSLTDEDDKLLEGKEDEYMKEIEGEEKRIMLLEEYAIVEY